MHRNDSMTEEDCAEFDAGGRLAARTITDRKQDFACFHEKNRSSAEMDMGDDGRAEIECITLAASALLE